MSAGSEWSVEIKAPREMAVTLGDVGALIKQYRQELRAAQKESNAFTRTNKDVSSDLEAKVQYAKSRLDAAVDQRNYIKAMAEGSLIDMREKSRPEKPKPASHSSPDHSFLDRSKRRQDDAATVSAEMNSILGVATSNMPVWAIVAPRIGVAASYGNQLRYYGEAVSRSLYLKSVAEKGAGTAGGMAASAAMSIGSTVARVGGSLAGVSAAMMGPYGIAALAVGGAIYGATEFSVAGYRRAEADAKMRSALADVALAASRDIMAGGDNIRLQTMQRASSIVKAAQTNMMAIQKDASIWEQFSTFVYGSGSVDAADAATRAGAQAEKVARIRNIYGERFYESITNRETARATVERRISLRDEGYQGWKRALELKAGRAWASITGTRDGYERLIFEEEFQRWQDDTMKTAETLRDMEKQKWERSISHALDRVLANERRRNDAAFAREQYSRYNDWATI